MSTNAEKVTELRERGNECMRANNYAEAVLHYSHAIKLDSSSPQLYSNRSYGFLKLQHFYHALEDANEAIRLDPNWAKGYFRKAECGVLPPSTMRMRSNVTGVHHNCRRIPHYSNVY
nr:STI1-like protein [Penaeus vannamei]